ncbi:MAG TPA: hypothetical protein VNF74_01630 [Terriglobales bacterium]|nr:hypothetical protein [Terriglobales bacterium]
METALAASNVVLLDPDTGLVPPSGRLSKRHATLDEIAGFCRGGKAVCLIVFPARVNHDEQVQTLHGRLGEASGGRILTLRTCVSVPGKKGRVPRVRWFTLINHDTDLECRALQFAEDLNEIQTGCAITYPSPGRSRVGGAG